MRIATVEDKRVGRRGPALGHDEPLIDGHLFLLQLLEHLHLLVVVLLAVSAEQPLAVDPDRILEFGVFSCRLSARLESRERPRDEPRPRPCHRQALAVLPLEIVEPNRQAARLQSHGGRLRLPLAVNAVVFRDDTAIDGQPRAVVGVERERVVAIHRHLEKAGEHIAEEVGPQGWRDCDIEELARHWPRILSLQVVEHRQVRPGVAVEPKREIVEIATDGIGLVERLPRIAEFLLDLVDRPLRLVAAAVQVRDLLLVRFLFGVVPEQRPLNLGATIAHRREVFKEREQAVVVTLRNRVDLMVMAAGAVDRQAEKHLPGGCHDVVEPVVAELLTIGRLVVPYAKPVVARRDEGVIRWIGQFVAGQLLEHELVVGLVVIQ